MNHQNQYSGRGCCQEAVPLPAQGRTPDVPLPYMPEHAVLAMAYVPMQEFTALYSPEEGLTRGTAFPCLDLPFMGRTVGGGYRYV